MPTLRRSSRNRGRDEDGGGQEDSSKGPQKHTRNSLSNGQPLSLSYKHGRLQGEEDAGNLDLMRRSHVHAHQWEEVEEQCYVTTLPVHERFDHHPQFDVEEAPEPAKERRVGASLPNCGLVAQTRILRLAALDDLRPHARPAPLGAIPEEEEEEEELVQPVEIHLDLLVELLRLRRPLHREPQLYRQRVLQWPPRDVLAIRHRGRDVFDLADRAEVRDR